MVLRNASTNSGSIVSPSTNSSEVWSQSTRPSFRAMKPSRLAAMWMVTREVTLGSECEKYRRCEAGPCDLAFGLGEAIRGHDLARAIGDLAPVRDHLLPGIIARVDMVAGRKR